MPKIGFQWQEEKRQETRLLEFDKLMLRLNYEKKVIDVSKTQKKVSNTQNVHSYTIRWHFLCTIDTNKKT